MTISENSRATPQFRPSRFFLRGKVFYNYGIMTRAFNFSPGPCGLPDAVMEKAKEEFLNYGGEGASVMELSHRGAAFMEVCERARTLLCELLGIGDDFAVLFLSGGATGQAATVPMNLIADPRQPAAYAITGHWSRRASEEAKRYCRVHVAADTKDQGYATLPARLDVPNDAVYLHYADNETIHGVEFPRPPSAPVPLVSDMSSNILSRPLDVEDYGVIYGGAQKNLGPAGVAIVIVRKSLIHPRAQTPAVWDYAKNMRADSMVNTPPTFPIYMMGLVLEWLKNEGGPAEMERRNREKSRLLYERIDKNEFYNNNVPSECRSRMNVPFFLKDEKLTGDFLKGAGEIGMIGLKGHSVLGGCRASLYNSMPEEGVRQLVSYMDDFEKRRG